MSDLVMDEFCKRVSHQIDVLDSSVHYLDCGDGLRPILLLHGMPCSSSLWCNILPELSKVRRCIAPDLMGMGKSGAAGIPYSIIDHIRYIEAFINKLKLQNITLVVHGWGSVIGLDMAARMPERFSGLIMCESHLRPITQWSDLALPVQELLSQLGDEDQMRERILEDNFLIEEWLPSYKMEKLTLTEIRAYREKFKEPASREVLLQYFRDLPIGLGHDEATRIITNYSSWLCESKLPKLLIYGIPGFVTTMASVSFANDNFPNLTLAEIPDSLHFIPETSPEVFILAVKEWMDVGY